MNDEIFGYGGAGQFTGLALGTMRAMVSRRQIPHLRLGPRLVRFRRSDLERWLGERLVMVRPSEQRPGGAPTSPVGATNVPQQVAAQGTPRRPSKENTR